MRATMDERSATERMKVLRDRFIERLPARLADLETIWGRIPPEGWIDERAERLERIAHGLAGSGGTFDLHDLTERARVLESLIAEVRSRGEPPGEAELREIEGSIGRLGAAVEGSAPSFADVPTEDIEWERDPRPDARRDRPRVLIVEDDELLAEVLRAVLEAAGLECLRETDGEAAVRRARETVPDLILFDVDLPGVDGFEAFRRVRRIEALGRTAVVFLTGRQNETDLTHAFDLGADDYLTKPFEPRLVAAKVKALLARKRSTPAAGYLPPGFVLDGRYRILRTLGRGGMGVVYLAQHEQLGTECAIKVLRDEAETGRARFEREVRLLAGLRHRHVVAVHDAGLVDGLRYYVMDALPGPSLSDRLATRGRLAADDALEIIAKIADALAVAHRRGILHRDIKPENILFDAEGEPVLADFGVSLDLGASTRLTAEEFIVGTLRYLSPEQARGSVDLDGRCDVYALGVVLFEMLTGRTPFHDRVENAAILEISRTTPPSPRTLVPDLPDAVESICRSALAVDRADRIRTADQLADACRRALAPAEAPETSPPTSGPDTDGSPS